jgi:phenylpropionate dioxygenase-like ring-hydroxylating dioxygenase large terminal subunit
MSASVTSDRHSGDFDDVDPHADGRRLAYPEGWFQVAYSDELRPGQVQKLHYFGQELALFRTESGKAQVLDA